MKTILLGAVVLAVFAGCEPHPTHPTKVDCSIVMETTFTAMFDTTPPSTTGGGIRPSPDPCTAGGGILTPQTWTQTNATSFSICVARGTTAMAASDHCRTHMASRPTAGNVTPRPPRPGRMCPGTLQTLSMRTLGEGGALPVLTENGCSNVTTLPLVP